MPFRRHQRTHPFDHLSFCGGDNGSRWPFPMKSAKTVRQLIRENPAERAQDRGRERKFARPMRPGNASKERNFLRTRLIEVACDRRRGEQNGE